MYRASRVHELGDQQPLSILVIAGTENRVEAVNSALRNAGLLARCVWANSLRKADDELAGAVFDLILAFTKTPREELKKVIRLRDKHQADTPVLAADSRVEEERICDAITSGARDMVSLSQLQRLHQVIEREVEVGRLRRAHAELEEEAAFMRERLGSLVEESSDAIVFVSEGIIVEANPAFAETFGFDDPESVVGHPLMDVFAPVSQALLKGALKACMKGRWNGDLLDAQAIHSDGTEFPVQLEIELAEFEGEPCIHVSFRLPEAEAAEAEAAVPGTQDPVTGLILRRPFLESVGERLREKQGGVRLFAYIGIDGNEKLAEQHGPLAADDILEALGIELRERFKENDVGGRLGDWYLSALISRGAVADGVAWAEQFAKTVSDRLFDVRGKSIPATVSIGLAEYDSSRHDADSLIKEAGEAWSTATAAGGDQAVLYEPPEIDEEGRLTDDAWSKRIKEAIKHNRFRLVFQSIASLQGGSGEIHDVLVRMVGEEDEEIMPGDFLPAATRTGMMVAIDRWIIAHSVKNLMRREEGQLLVRVSEASVVDRTLAKWLKSVIGQSKVAPGRLILQLAEKTAEIHLKDSMLLNEELKAMGCGFALEHFGVGSSSRQTLGHLPSDFVKVDGSLMQGITRDPKLQDRVKGIIDMAKEKGIPTVAERVEDANTMAVLWQLGAEYIQGHYVQEPEVVIAEG